MGGPAVNVSLSDCSQNLRMNGRAAGWIDGAAYWPCASIRVVKSEMCVSACVAPLLSKKSKSTSCDSCMSVPLLKTIAVFWFWYFLTESG